MKSRCPCLGGNRTKIKSISTLLNVDLNQEEKKRQFNQFTRGCKTQLEGRRELGKSERSATIYSLISSR